MKLVNFIYQGEKHYGIVQNNCIVDLFPLIGHQYTSLQDVLDKNALHELQEFQHYPETLRFEDIIFYP